MIGTRHIGPGHQGEFRDGLIENCPDCFTVSNPTWWLMLEVRELTKEVRELTKAVRALTDKRYVKSGPN